MDRFDEVLKELGQILNLPLHPDKHRACKLNINQTLHVQMEPDGLNEKLLIGTYLVDVPAGRFREDVFCETLKYNADPKRIGTFAYSSRNNQLFYFHYLPLHRLNGEALCDFLSAFITIAESWKQAIQRGQSAPASSPKGGGSVPFGLKP